MARFTSPLPGPLNVRATKLPIISALVITTSARGANRLPNSWKLLILTEVAEQMFHVNAPEATPPVLMLKPENSTMLLPSTLITTSVMLVVFSNENVMEEAELGG